MNWKSWPYWVRGGVWAALPVSLLAAIVFFRLKILATVFSVSQMFFVYPGFWIVKQIERLIGCTEGKGIFATPGLPPCSERTEGLIEFLALFSIVGLYFCLGVFLGHIYGKYKSRKIVGLKSLLHKNAVLPLRKGE